MAGPIELPGWSFEVNEVSVGVFRVYGRDVADRTIEATGTDPEALLRRCTREAAELARGRPRDPEGGTS